MSADITKYLDYITSEYRNQPNFVSVVSAVVQPLADENQVVQEFPLDYDLDVAVGAQLDTVGLWIGQSRYLSEPLTNVYFSFDIAGLGFDQGTWLGPFDPTSGLVALPDDEYRVLLRAKIANNQWDGTVPSAYKFMAPVFPGDTFFIIDNQDMSMYIGVAGPVPLNAVTFALLTGGYLNIKPAGVRIAGYITSTTPLFGFDVEDPTIAGFDVGSWSTFTEA